MDKYAAMGSLALLMTVLGAAAIGGAFWLLQGAVQGTGDIVGAAILIPVGVTALLFGLGAALAAVVTYLVHTPPPREGVPAVQEAAKEAGRTIRSWLPFGRRD